MSDFDFDEIDKAVAGVIGDDSSQPTPSDELVKTNTESTAAEPAPRPEVTAAPEKVAPVAPAPASRRSAGRFMDVVHPSSDMRTKNAFFKPPVTRPIEAPAEQAVQPQNAVDELDLIEDEAWSKPLKSPFLPDAKVEKRPLGAPEPTVPLVEEPEEELLLEAPDEPLLEAHVMPDPIDFAAHSSALPSESEDTGTPVVEEAVAQSVEAPTEELNETEQAPIVEGVPTVEEPQLPAETPVEDPAPSGPASITQQYTEQPSSAPSSGAIYDTENYHKPLAPAEKKHSGVWVALWIILLVILGAGAGVAFYLFVLPML